MDTHLFSKNINIIFNYFLYILSSRLFERPFEITCIKKVTRISKTQLGSCIAALRSPKFCDVHGRCSEAVRVTEAAMLCKISARQV